MKLSAKEVSDMVGGVLEGDDSVVITSLAKIEEGHLGSISFLANLKYQSFLYTTQSSVVIINDDFEPEKNLSCTVIRVVDAYSAFSILLQQFTKSEIKTGIEQPSFISPDVIINEDCYVGAFAYIGSKVVIGKNVKIYPHVFIGDNCVIGDNVILHPGVKIYHHCELGNNIVVHASSVIGSDGFGFAPQSDGSFTKIVQSGNVVIEDHVEIGSNTSIDRATIGSTIIKKGVKLDNLIQIAHNVEIGKNTVVASQAGISGSTKIGDNCVIGGQVGIVGHIYIANGTQINAQSGVSKSIKEESKLWNGSPLSPFRDALKSQVVYRRLPDLEKRIEDLEQLLKELRHSTL